MLRFSQHRYNLEQYPFAPIGILLSMAGFFDFSTDFPPPRRHVPCVITQPNGAKELMAHIFDCSSDHRISGAICIDTCAEAVTDSGIGVAAAEGPARGATA
jgi:hypothetical protein